MNNGSVNNGHPSGQLLKFFIGFFAGLCATIVPKMVTALATSDPGGNMVLFSNDYLIISVSLSIIIGLGIMLVKWNEKCVPNLIFMSALGLPAVISGSFNMSAGLQTLDRKQFEIDKLNTTLSEEQGISSFSADQLQIVPLNPLDPVKQSLFEPESWTSRLSIIGTAQAQQSQPQKLREFNPGQVVREDQYFIVINKGANLVKIKSALKRIQAKVPTAAIVKGAREYYILDSLQPQSQTAATLKAVQLKKKLPASKIGLMKQPSRK